MMAAIPEMTAMDRLLDTLNDLQTKVVLIESRVDQTHEMLTRIGEIILRFDELSKRIPAELPMMPPPMRPGTPSGYPGFPQPPKRS